MSQSEHVCVNKESVQKRVHAFVLNNNAENPQILTRKDLGWKKVAACHLHTHKQQINTGKD